MDWAAGSSSSPLSGSGNVSSSAVIDKDAQVNDSERTDGKWRHEVVPMSSTEESCGIATPFSSKKHDIEQGLFIGPAVGTSLTKKMTVNWQDDTACDADFSTRCCDHFSHCGGLGGSIAMATMRAQLGQMSHFSRLAKCCLAKRLLGDGDVKRIPSEVSGATTVSCGDVAECVLVKKRRKKKVPKRRKNFCSAGLDSEDERSVDEIVRLIEGIGETVKKDKKSKRKYNCKANTVAVSERTLGANETVVSSIEAGAGSGEVKAISFNGVDGHSDVIRKKRRDDQQDWMCVAVVTDPHNGNVSEMSSTSDALNFRQLGESTGVLEMECIDELDFPRSAAASKKKMHAADKLDRRASAMSVAEKDGSEDFSGTLEENLQTGSGRQPNAKEASVFDLRSDHFVGYSQQNCALRGRRSMGLFADLMHTNKLFSPPSSKDDNHRRKWRAEKEKSRTVEGVSLAASCMNEGHNEYSDQRLTQRSNPYGSPVTSDLDDGGYATWNFEMPLASGGENDSNRNLNLVLPHRAVLSKHKLTGNFPTCSDPVCATSESRDIHLEVDIISHSSVTQCASEELNGGASRPVIFDVLTLSATEEGNALLKEISFFYESKKPIYNSDNCHVEDADALVESRERSGIVAEEHGISSRASPLMTNFTPKVEEESTESVRTARVRNERCLSNRAASNMFVTAADASNATIFIDRMHQFLVHQMAQMWDEFLTEGEPPTSYSTTANCTSDEATTLRYNHDIANDLNDDDREPPHGSY